MASGDMRRRDFNRLSLAAFSGLLAGTALGACSNGSGGGGAADAGGDAAAGDAPATPDLSAMLVEPHVCRGLNTCEGHGADGKNSCAGVGSCATANAHSCHGHNDCTGQGGCGDFPGANSCSGKGECGVPLSDKAWAKARLNFETAMKAAGKDVGEAPPKS